MSASWWWWRYLSGSGGVSRRPGQRRENLSGQASGGAKGSHGRRRVGGRNLIGPPHLPPKREHRIITRREVVSLCSLPPITRLCNQELHPKPKLVLRLHARSAALSMRPRTGIASRGTAVIRGLAVMVGRPSSWPRRRTNNKADGRGVKTRASASKQRAARIGGRRYSAPAARTDNNASKTCAPHPDARDQAPATASPIAPPSLKIYELRTTNQRSRREAHSLFRTGSAEYARRQWRKFAIDRATTKARSGDESPLTAGQAHRECTEDALMAASTAAAKIGRGKPVDKGEGEQTHPEQRGGRRGGSKGAALASSTGEFKGCPGDIKIQKE